MIQNPLGIYPIVIHGQPMGQSTGSGHAKETRFGCTAMVDGGHTHHSPGPKATGRLEVRDLVQAEMCFLLRAAQSLLVSACSCGLGSLLAGARSLQQPLLLMPPLSSSDFHEDTCHWTSGLV